MSRRVRVYVAAAYTIGQQIHNVRRCALLAKKLWDMGYIVVCPLLTHFLDYVAPMGYDDWMEFDRYALDTCHCLVWDQQECPGESRGAEVEVDYMNRTLKRPCYSSVESLVALMPPDTPAEQLPEIKL